MTDYETQARIVHQSNLIRDEIKNLVEWEKDMKQKEAKRIASVNEEEAFDPSYPMRNQMQTEKTAVSASSTALETSSEHLKRKTPIPNAIEKANEFKVRGNDCVKQAQYQKAIHYYTEAIRLNKSEPVYYTNRALCYLKQSKFNECIDDCTMAIRLDDKAVKAYYRRMLAIQQMQGNLDDAISDGKIILSIDPKNVDAQRTLSQLEGLLKESKKTPIELPPWSQFDGKDGYERIDFVSKPPHLRSKTPVKRITILDCDSKNTTSTPILADSNRTEHTEAIATTNIDQTQATKKHPNIVNELKIPQNAAQFYKTWTTLTDDSQKFTVLKGIYNADIGRMLGAQFNLETLRDIFTILKSHFINQNLPIANILNGIIRNSQMIIISAMMNAEDKLAFTKMVEYMRIRGEDAKLIETIQKHFDDLILM